MLPLSHNYVSEQTVYTYILIGLQIPNQFGNHNLLLVGIYSKSISSRKLLMIISSNKLIEFRMGQQLPANLKIKARKWI